MNYIKTRIVFAITLPLSICFAFWVSGFNFDERGDVAVVCFILCFKY